jgi:hypothetical protein
MSTNIAGKVGIVHIIIVPTTAVTVLAFTAHPYMGLWAQGRP